MAKQIKFSYKGEDYILEFTRASIKKMEDQGIYINQATNKPITILPELFAGAFLAHHPRMKRPLINEIFGNIKKSLGENEDGEIELFGKLAEMFEDGLNSIMEVKDEKNAISWEANF